LTSNGKIEGRLRRLEQIDTCIVTTAAGRYRLECVLELVDEDRAILRKVRALERELNALLDEHGATLRDEPGIGPIAAATLICKVGDPNRFAPESKFARRCGTRAVALSSGEGKGIPVRHRLDYGGNRRISGVLYIASATQRRDIDGASAYLARNTSEGKPREARQSHKRHPANLVIRRMWHDERHRHEPHHQIAA
jgi:transposase